MVAAEASPDTSTLLPNRVSDPPTSRLGALQPAWACRQLQKGGVELGEGLGEGGAAGADKLPAKLRVELGVGEPGEVTDAAAEAEAALEGVSVDALEGEVVRVVLKLVREVGLLSGVVERGRRSRRKRQKRKEAMADYKKGVLMACFKASCHGRLQVVLPYAPP
jgi:hypothetical protein